MRPKANSAWVERRNGARGLREMSSVDSRYGGGGKDRSAWTLRWLMDSSDEEQLGKRLVN